MHTARITENFPLHLITTRDGDGIECYFILRASPVSIRKLREQPRSGAINLDEYGEILTSGYGKHPTKRERQSLTQRYGIRFDD